MNRDEPEFLNIFRECLAQDEKCLKLEQALQAAQDNRVHPAELNRLKEALLQVQIERNRLYDEFGKAEKPKARKKEREPCQGHKGNN